VEDVPPYEVRDSEHGLGSVLIPTSPWNAEIEARLALGDIDGLRLSYSAGFRGANTTFLLKFSELRSIEIYSQEILDLAPLKGLPRLRLLGLQTGKTSAFQPHWFPELRILLCQWRKGMDGLLQIPSIEYLNVINWPYADLTALSGLRSLRRLAIASRRLTTLLGIDAHEHLEQIDLYQCPQLESVGPLEQCAKLTKVEIEGCRHVPNRRIG
jgi:hypothetical protein